MYGLISYFSENTTQVNIQNFSRPLRSPFSIQYALTQIEPLSLPTNNDSNF